MATILRLGSNMILRQAVQSIVLRGGAVGPEGPSVAGDVDWGVIGGTLSDQTDLQNAVFVIPDKVAGESIALHQPVYLVDTAGVGKWRLARAFSFSEFDGQIGIARNDAAEDEALTVQILGEVSDVGWSWLVGAPVYLGDGFGELTQIRPEWPCVIGFASSPTSIRVSPSISAAALAALVTVKLIEHNEDDGQHGGKLVSSPGPTFTPGVQLLGIDETGYDGVRLGLKTINSTSLLGSGDIVVSASPAGATNELQRNDGAGALAAATGVTWTGNQLLVTAQAAATVPFCVMLAASQVANGFELKNSSSTVLASLNASGQHAANKYLAVSPSQGGIDFLSGYTRLLGYDGKIGVAINASTGVPVGIQGWGFGANYFTTDALLVRIAAAIIGVRGATSSAGAALSFIEQTAPSAPATNGVYIYAEDDGAGKTRLMGKFATGAAQQILIEA